ncbi:MAG: cob(I)yrinic acid a,c-diamide adenosyltransferase [Patescibacteria group bacterium]
MKTPFFTGRGDDGRSRVGSRAVSKHHAYLVVLGALDEVNSYLGLARTEAARAFPAHRAGDLVPEHELLDMQQALFTAQAEIAALAFGSPKGAPPQVADAHVRVLEALIRRVDALLPPLHSFVVPGGTELAARLDLARTVARRAERAVSVLSALTPLRQPLLAFMNRLSSALFALARYANHYSGVHEEHPHYE